MQGCDLCLCFLSHFLEPSFSLVFTVIQGYFSISLKENISVAFLAHGLTCKREIVCVCGVTIFAYAYNICYDSYQKSQKEIHKKGNIFLSAKNLKERQFFCRLSENTSKY